MRLVVGLGNPGIRYERTRHNVGFDVVDRLVSRACGCSQYQQMWSAHLTAGNLAGQDVTFLKPQTFMNRSGLSVAQAKDHYGLEVEDILVIHDDIDLEYSAVRVKRGGGSGGHRGLNSCFAELESRDFDRVRVGIGRPDDLEQSVTEYVLEHFDEAQRGGLVDVLHLAADAAEATIQEGAAAAMNTFNRRRALGGEA